MPISTIALPIIEKILSSVFGVHYKEWYAEKIKPKIVPTLSKLRIYSFAKRSYFKELEKSIKKMPFIYRNLDIEYSIENFVDIEIRTLDTRNLETSASKRNTFIASKLNFARLNENVKLIIVGNAGIGKSTLLSYITYCIIKKKKISGYDFNKKGLVPIFIPLKAVQNIKRSPIVDYILENVPLFNKHNGDRLLVKLISQRKVFLILDGYDEISFSAKENYIKDEIALLLNDGTLLDDENINDKYKRIYEEFHRAKVWVSSREEFYRSNEIVAIQDKTDTVIVPLVEVSGLGQNRPLYVDFVFKSLKKKNAILKEKLDYEVFVSSIDRTYDEELIGLSKIPLFLNILIYLYETKTQQTDSIIEKWEKHVPELLREFINLMLQDLDMDKIKDLTPAERHAFRDRRNSYKEEKKEFISFFAMSLYMSGKSTFDSDYLIEKVKYFFSKLSNSENAPTILNEIDFPSSSNPNLAFQLLYSGLFKIVDVQKKIKYYDFPHRRFKEILSLLALQNNEMFLHVGENLLEPGLSELILFAHTTDRELSKKIISLLYSSINEGNYKIINTLLLNCFNKKFNSEINQLFLDLIAMSIRMNEKVFLDKGVVQKLSINDEFVSQMCDLVVDKKQLIGLNTVCSLFLVRNTNALRVNLDKLTSSISGSNIHDTQLVKLKFTTLLNINAPEQVLSARNRSVASPCDFEMIQVLADICSDNQPFSDDYITKLLNSHDVCCSFYFLAALHVLNENQFYKYSQISKYHNLYAFFAIFMKSETYIEFENSELVGVLDSEISTLEEKLSQEKKIIDELRATIIAQNNGVPLTEDEIDKRMPLSFDKRDKIANLTSDIFSMQTFKVGLKALSERSFDESKKMLASQEFNRALAYRVLIY